MSLCYHLDLPQAVEFIPGLNVHFSWLIATIMLTVRVFLYTYKGLNFDGIVPVLNIKNFSYNFLCDVSGGNGTKWKLGEQ